MRFAYPLVLVGALSLSACAGMTTTEQRTLSGGAIGAASGAVITAATGGCVICGAAIGAGVGAVGGLLYDLADPYRHYRHPPPPPPPHGHYHY